MTNIDWESYQAAYTQAPSAVQNYVDSEALPNLITKLCSQHNLANSLKATIITLTIDRILALTSESTFITELEKLGVPEQGIVEIVSSIDMLVGEGKKPVPPAISATDDPVYTSTQSAILREGAIPAPATPSNEPRWDSAR